MVGDEGVLLSPLLSLRPEDDEEEDDSGVKWFFVRDCFVGEVRRCAVPPTTATFGTRDERRALLGFSDDVSLDDGILGEVDVGSYLGLLSDTRGNDEEKIVHDVEDDDDEVWIDWS